MLIYGSVPLAVPLTAPPGSDKNAARHIRYARDEATLDTHSTLRITNKQIGGRELLSYYGPDEH